MLTVETWLTAAEKVRLNFACRIVNESGVLILEAETRHVCIGLDEKLKRLPEELSALLQPCLHSPSSE
jgi:acyl-CoA thioesterase FadM